LQFNNVRGGDEFQNNEAEFNMAIDDTVGFKRNHELYDID